MPQDLLKRLIDLDITDQLPAQLADEVAAFPFCSEVMGAPLRDPGVKWIASSALQKAIRRSLVSTAVEMAVTLNHIDPSYLWDRLVGIALEDVGVANLQTSAKVILLASSKHLRHKLGLERTIQYAAYELAQSVKDQTTVHLLVTGVFKRLALTETKRLAGHDGRALKEIVQDSGTSLCTRIVALRHLAGFQDQDHRVISKGHPDEFWDLGSRISTNPYYVFIMNKARTRGGDLRTMLPLAMLVHDGSDPVVVSDTLTEEPYVGPYPVEALDMFTRIGQRAIDRLTKKEFGEYVQPGVNVKKAVRWAVFQVEGSRVATRFRFPRSDYIQRLAETSELQETGLPGHLHSGLRERAQASLPKLNSIRRVMWERFPGLR